MDTTTILPNVDHDHHHSKNRCRTATTIGKPSPSKLKCVVKKTSAGKKDRQSKIHTAQGLRDRRMRLSVHTARKFFDLNDMLGFDKASKTIEWLFSKSHEAIQEVTETVQSDAVADAQTTNKEINDENLLDVQIQNTPDDDHSMKESLCYPVEFSNTYHFLKHLHLDSHNTMFDYNNSRNNPLLGIFGGWNPENRGIESQNRIVTNSVPLDGNMINSSNFLNFNSENQEQ